MTQEDIQNDVRNIAELMGVKFGPPCDVKVEGIGRAQSILILRSELSKVTDPPTFIRVHIEEAIAQVWQYFKQNNIPHATRIALSRFMDPSMVHPGEDEPDIPRGTQLIATLRMDWK